MTLLVQKLLAGVTSNGVDAAMLRVMPFYLVDSVEVPAGGEDMESPTASPSPGGQPGGLPLWN